MVADQQNAKVNITQVVHEIFLVKAARTKQSVEWHGRRPNMFMEAVSIQWNAWQENAAASVIAPNAARVILAGFEDTWAPKSCVAVKMCFCRQERGSLNEWQCTDQKEASGRIVVERCCLASKMQEISQLELDTKIISVMKSMFATCRHRNNNLFGDSVGHRRIDGEALVRWTDCGGVIVLS